MAHLNIHNKINNNNNSRYMLGSICTNINFLHEAEVEEGLLRP